MSKRNAEINYYSYKDDDLYSISSFSIYSANCNPFQDEKVPVCTHYSKRTGFTIIELLIVMAIIGIVMGIAGHNNSRVIKKSRDASLQINIGHIRNSVYQFCLSNNGRFPEHLSELSPDFIKETPITWKGSLASGQFGYNSITGDVVLNNMDGEVASVSKDEKGRVYGTY